MTPLRDEVLSEIDTERDRQEAKFGPQHRPLGFSSIYEPNATAAKRECDGSTARGVVTWREILLEEVWEALAEESPEKAETELVQVAAVCVNIIEDLRRSRGGPTY